MKDSVGKEIKEGDTIVYSRGPNGNLRKAQVLSVEEGRICIQMEPRWTDDKPSPSWLKSYGKIAVIEAPR